MGTLISSPDQIDIPTISRLFHEKGILDRGAVTDIQVVVTSSFTAKIARLVLSYSEEAPSSAPVRLFLKMSVPGPAVGPVGRQQRKLEVEFHRDIAPLMGDPPLVSCFDAVFDDATGGSHLLFADLSDTHFQTQRPLPPPLSQSERTMDAFAEFHAFWWDHPSLGDIDTLPNPQSTASYARSVRECFPRFADFLEDRLSEPRRRIYDRVLDTFPRLLERTTGGANVTLIHGDANFWNVLLPRDPDKDRAFIIDWQLWNISFAAEDIANLIALHCYADRRQVMEEHLLKRYHRGLLAHGVEDFDWLDFRRDYRLAVITRVLFMPMWLWATGQPPSSWWSDLERAMQAFDDLSCDEFLEWKDAGEAERGDLPMKSIYVIGDSISVQYGPYLEKYLSGRFAYSRKDGDEEAQLDLDNPTGANGGDSEMVLAFLEAKRLREGIDADYLLLNCGLHDIKTDLETGVRQVSLERYRKNLKNIISIVSGMRPRLIWIRTTPCDEHIHNRPGMSFHRFSTDYKTYIKAADDIMASAHVPSIDLYTFTVNVADDLYCDHVHFHEHIREKQAAYIAGWLDGFAG